MGGLVGGLPPEGVCYRLARDFDSWRGRCWPVEPDGGISFHKPSRFVASDHDPPRRGGRAMTWGEHFSLIGRVEAVKRLEKVYYRWVLLAWGRDDEGEEPLDD